MSWDEAWIMRLPEFHPFRSGDHDTSSGHDLHRVRGANREASSPHQGHTVSWIYSSCMRILWDPMRIYIEFIFFSYLSTLLPSWDSWVLSVWPTVSNALRFSRIPVYEVRFDNIIGLRWSFQSTIQFVMRWIVQWSAFCFAGVVSMKTLIKNADCLEEIVDSNSRKVSEIIDTAIFVPDAGHEADWIISDCNPYQSFKLQKEHVDPRKQCLW